MRHENLVSGRRVGMALMGVLVLAGVGGSIAASGALARSGAQTGSAPAEVTRQIDRVLPQIETLYKEIHAQPELSLQEAKTSARLAREMKAAGYEVSEGVGGYGVVAVLKNGQGPTVLIRTDMDALPVEEKSGVPYASKARTKDAEGRDVPVMHACGHDVHMACWVGTAKVLAALKDRWKGTVVFVGQPAEEIVAGARMMLAAGLYQRFPKPDFCLALHTGALASGRVGYRSGPTNARADSVDIIMRGRGGHGAAPHKAVDPVVLAARVVLDLQTFIGREIDPVEPAVITVGSIQGGAKRNVIPNDVTLKLTIRSYSDTVGNQLLEGIERIARAVAQGAKAPEPIVRVFKEEGVPPMVNDPALTARLVGLFRQTLGAENVQEMPAVMGSEDFGLFGQGGIPTMMYRLGIFTPEQVARDKSGAQPLPPGHSDTWCPAPELLGQTLRTGMLTMSVGVMELLGK